MTGQPSIPVQPHLPPMHHPLRCESSLLELQLCFTFVCCYHPPIIHEGAQVHSQDQLAFPFFPWLIIREANLCHWPETKVRTHFLGDVTQSLPFSS